MQILPQKSIGIGLHLCMYEHYIDSKVFILSKQSGGNANSKFQFNFLITFIIRHFSDVKDQLVFSFNETRFRGIKVSKYLTTISIHAKIGFSESILLLRYLLSGADLEVSRIN